MVREGSSSAGHSETSSVFEPARPGRGHACGERYWRSSSTWNIASPPKATRVWIRAYGPSGSIPRRSGMCS